jgi:hypothetical protein
VSGTVPLTPNIEEARTRENGPEPQQEGIFVHASPLYIALASLALAFGFSAGEVKAQTHASVVFSNSTNQHIPYQLKSGFGPWVSYTLMPGGRLAHHLSLLPGEVLTVRYYSPYRGWVVQRLDLHPIPGVNRFVFRSDPTGLDIELVRESPWPIP